MKETFKNKLQNMPKILFKSIENDMEQLEITFDKHNIYVDNVYDDVIILSSYISNTDKELNKLEKANKLTNFYFKMKFYQSGCICSNYIKYHCIIKEIIVPPISEINTINTINNINDEYNVKCYQLEIYKKNKIGLYSYKYELYNTFSNLI